MAFSINQFKSVIAPSEFMRNNKFRVRVAVPIGLLQTPDRPGLVRDLEFYCHRTRLPGVAIKTFEHQRYGYGPSQQVPSKPQFVDANFDFYNDGDGAILDFFRNWMNLIIPFDFSQGLGTNYTVAYRTEYTSEMMIDTFNEHGVMTSSIVLREAWPVSLDTIDLNWSDTNDLQNVHVIMNYNDWYEQLA